MKSTTNYQLVKQELTDKADITQISGNWDKIDTEMKHLSDEKFDKTGGTITGNLTVTNGAVLGSLSVTREASIGGTLSINGKLTASGAIEVTGDSTFNNNLTIKGITTHENPIRSTKAEFLQTQANVVRGTPPASTIFNYWSVFDKNGWNVSTNRLAHIDYTVDANGVASLAMYVNKYVAGSTETGAGIYARWSGETPTIATTHHPATNSNDYSIATTAWVKQTIVAQTSTTKLVRW